jgi:type VI secretion system protein ImpH
MEEVLRDEPWSFEFFQAVALLQRLRPGTEAVGRFSNPEDEAIQFRSNSALGFPPSTIQKINWPESGPVEMWVNFMGLCGPMGILPFCYSELVLERLQAKDKSLAAFLDIFNHRMISFFYRAWEKYRFPITYSLGDRDQFTHHLLDLIGLGTPGLQGRLGLPDDALLHFTGLLAQQSRSAPALEQILSDYFEVPVEVEQFVGGASRIDTDTQCCLDETDSDSQRLGLGAVVGDEIWDQQSRVRVKLGPMALAQYRQFLPDGNAYKSLAALTKFFCNAEFDFEVQLILKHEEVPLCGIDLDEAAAPRLGWVSWLKSKPFSQDPGDTILNLE